MHMLKYNYIKFEVKLLQTPELFKLKSAIYYRYFTKSLYLMVEHIFELNVRVATISVNTILFYYWFLKV